MRKSILLSLSALALLQGCGKKAEGQTVAVVNGEEITANELNSELAALNLGERGSKDEARQSTLQSMIDRRLLSQQAREEGIDKSPEYIAKQRRADEDLLIGLLMSRKGSTAALPAEADIQAFIDGRPEMFAKRELWTLQQIQYVTSDNADVQRKIAATKTLDDLARVLTQAGLKFQRSQNRIDTAIVPHSLYNKVIALPPTEPFVLGFPANGTSVANVIVSREAAPRIGDAAKPIAIEAIRREANTKAMQQRLTELRGKAKITYQSGFAPDATKHQSPTGSSSGAAP